MTMPFSDERAALDDALLAGVLRAPAGLYLTGDEQLRLTIRNAAAGVAVTVRGRFLDLDGHIERFGDSVTPATDRTASTLTIRLGRGWLQGAAVVVSTGTPLIGQCYAIVSLVRGEGSIGLDEVTLAAGYVTAVQRLAFPGSGIKGSLDGPGAIRSVTGTNPAAGVEIIETVPTGARWRLHLFHAVLTPSGTAGNRGAVFTLDDGTNVFFEADPGNNATAGVAMNYNAGPGSHKLALATQTTTWNLPTDLVLAAGSRIRTVTANLKVDDDWAAPQLQVEEWIEGA